MDWKYRVRKRRRGRWIYAAVVLLAAGIAALWIHSEITMHGPADSCAGAVKEMSQSCSSEPPGCSSAEPPRQTGCIPVPLLGQEQLGLPTGCELVGAYMLLQYYGCDFSFEEWVEDCVPMSDFWYEDGQTFNLSPAQAFIGRPEDEGGYGCYAPVICEALQKAMPDAQVLDLTGSTLNELCGWLDKGVPVLLWATMGMIPSAPGNEWQTPQGPFQWIANEHCLVLVGADESFCYFNDPSCGEQRSWCRELVELRYEELGMQAVVLLKG